MRRIKPGGRGNSKHKTVHAGQRPVDILEPRVLYSADAMGALLPDTGDDGDDEQHQAEFPLLPPDDVAHPQSSADAHRTLALVDQQVEDYRELAQQLRDEGFEVRILDMTSGPVDSISNALHGESGLDAVHLFSHGSEGELRIAGDVINIDTLQQHAEQVAAWGSAFSDTGDFLVYGCDVASGESGLLFSERLSVLTGTDVATSVDLTGHEALGGDWTLEARTGEIDAASELSAVDFANWRSSLATVEFVVTRTDDNAANVGGLDMAALNLILPEERTLRQVVTAINSVDESDPDDYVIRLEDKTYTLSLAARGDLDVRHSMTIRGVDGANTIIEQTLADRVLEIGSEGAENTVLTLKDVGLTGGNTSADGGGVLVGENTALIGDDLTFFDNATDARGGAILNNGSVTLVSSAFTGNDSLTAGGAIYSDGALTLDSVSFHDNYSGQNGGAIYYNNTDPAQVSHFLDVTFTLNIAEGDGGALFNVGHINLERVTFGDADDALGNVARGFGGLSGNGGAIFNTDIGSLSGSDWRFENNEAYQGGGIFNQGAIHNGDTANPEAVSGLVFKDNTVNDVGASGAGLYVSDGSVHLDDVTFDGNTAQGSGGALTIGVDGVVAMTSAVLDGNRAIAESGGAVVNRGALTMDDAVFTNNVTEQGGGGALYGWGATTISNASFIGNEAHNGHGGAVVHQPPSDTSLLVGTLTLDRTYFEDNLVFDPAAAQSYDSNANTGGAVAVFTDNAAITATTFTGNQAFRGGALWVGGQSATVVNATFHDNQAREGGGIWSGQDLLVSSSTFSGNRDDVTGGAITTDGATVTIANSLFHDNTSGADGQGSIGGSVNSLGFNLFDSLDGTTFVNAGAGPMATDIVGVDPLLGTLEQRDTHIYTLSPGFGSVAVNAGSSVAAGSDIDATGSVRDELPDIGAHELDSVSQTIFWSDVDGSIHRSDEDLTVAQTIVEGRPTDANAPRDLEVDIVDGRLYWIENDGSEVWSSALDGSDVVRFGVLSSFAINGISVDQASRRLIIAYEGPSPFVLAYDIDATGDAGTPEVISGFSGMVDPLDIVYNPVAEQFIWLESSDGDARLHVADADGRNAQVLATSPAFQSPQAFSLDVAGQVLFVVDANPDGSSSVMTVHLDTVGGQSVTVGAVQDVAPVFTSDQVFLPDAADASFTVISEDLEILEVDGTRPTEAVPVSVAVTTASGNDAAPLLQGDGVVNAIENEDAAITTADLFAIDDVASADELLVQLSAPSQGMLLINGVDWSTLPAEGQQFTLGELSDGSVVLEYRYTGAPVTGTATDSLTFTVSDGTHVTTGALLFVVTEFVNQAPDVLSNTSVTVTEDMPLVLDVGAFDVQDDVDPFDVLVFDVQTDTAGQPFHFELNAGGVPITQFTGGDVMAGQVSIVFDAQDYTGGAVDVELLVFDQEGLSSPMTLDIVFIAVNDVPVFIDAPDTPQAAEHLETVIDMAFVNLEDVDTDPADLILSIGADAMPSQGVVFLRDPATGEETFATPVAPLQLSYEQLLGGWLIYDQNVEGPDALSDAFSITVTDAGSPTHESTHLINVDIANVNDAPFLDPAIVPDVLTVIEGGESVLSIDQLPLLDDDLADVPSNLMYSVTSVPVGGSLLVNGVVASGFSQQDVLDNVVVYRHDDSENTGPGQLVLQVSDSGAPVGELTVTVDLDVQAINDAPVFVDPSLAAEAIEHAETVIDASFVVLEDVDTAPADLMLTINADATTSHGVLFLRDPASGNESVASPGAPLQFTYEQLLAGWLIYDQNVDGPDALADAFTITAIDTGAPNHSATGQINFGLSNVNDAPHLDPGVVPGVLVVDEGGEGLLSVSQLPVIDDDLADTPARLNYSVTSLPAGASLLVNGALASSFTQQDVIDGAVVYRHDGTENTGSSQLLLQVSDSGTPVGELAVAVDIDVVQINDAPQAGSSASLSLLQAETIRLEAVQFPVTDTDTTPAGLLISLDAEALEAAGLAVVDDLGNVIDSFTLEALLDESRGVYLVQDGRDAAQAVQIGWSVTDGSSTDRGTLGVVVMAQPEPLPVPPEPAAPEPVPPEPVPPELPELGSAAPVSPAPANVVEPLTIPVTEAASAIDPTTGTVSTEPADEGVADTSPDTTQGSSVLDSQASPFTNSPEALQFDIRDLLASLDTDLLDPSVDQTIATQRISLINRIESASTASGVLDLDALILAIRNGDSVTDPLLSNALDRDRELNEEEALFGETLVGRSVGVASGLSVGYLIWLLRGGTLVGSMLSSLPAWRFVDPLPVLGTLGATDGDEDDESLQSIVEDGSGSGNERSGQQGADS